MHRYSIDIDIDIGIGIGIDTDIFFIHSPTDHRLFPLSWLI